MSNIIGRKVLVTRMHSTVHVVEAGTMGPTLDSNSARVKGALTMVTTEQGVLCSGKFQGKAYEFLVPYAVCLSVQLEPLEKA